MRKVKITEDTIGSLPCEISLNSILIKSNNAKLIEYCTKRYHLFKNGLKDLELLRESPRYKRMILLWKNEILNTIENRKDSLPPEAYSHLKCCIAARYRKALRSEQ